MQSLAAVGDNIFQAQISDPQYNQTYTMEVFKKFAADESTQEILNNYQVFSFEGKALLTINATNFAENSQLGFDITDMGQLRNFTQELTFLNLKSQDMVIMYFDLEQSLVCQSLDLSISFNFNTINKVKVDKQVQQRTISCKPQWLATIGYSAEKTTMRMRRRVTSK